MRTHKYRLYPNEEQKQMLAQAFGNARFVYNNALNFKKELYENEKKSVSKFDLNNRLPILKEEFAFLKESPSQTLQQSIGNLDKGFKNFFRRIKTGEKPGFPKFKNKYSKQSLTFPQRIRLDFKSDLVSIPKIGKVTAVLHRKLPENSKIKTCCVTKSITNKYFVSVVFEGGIPLPNKTFGKESAIDLGITSFVTFANGTKIQCNKFLKIHLEKLKFVQRKLSLKKKGSNNRKKTKFKLAKIYEKITNCRNDILHKISKEIIYENQVIFLEKLNVKSMMQNSNPNLARNISDVSWGNFINMLKYKADLYGKYVFEVPPEYTSKMCSNCYEINNDLELSNRTWQCKHCQAKHDRDVNAARNVLRIGQELPEYQQALNGSLRAA